MLNTALMSVALILTLFLSACGQKGDLYLPSSEPEQVQDVMDDSRPNPER